ncbi:alpha/beta fold hydrolase [Frigidibacter sp. SD6-1]|uniref:thioesterase II family protein n=1 Tax=Frigidibacter sp. SD6-1 TaxID=3032581 RepID=UPI0024DF42F0|nr:alpha/beta fold hydrolase [Frigidibacter sp. SD6-1]
MTTGATLQGDWLAHVPKPGATRRLVVFPYAGGNPSAFLGWSAALGPETALSVVTLPGRGPRRREPQPQDLRAEARQIAAALSRLGGPEPCHVFGHSMGAVLAFETLRAMTLMHLPLPRLFVASGCRWPAAMEKDDLHLLPEPQFRDRLRTLGGTPAEVLAHEELMALVTPVLRADFAMLNRYDYRPSIRLPVPLHLFAGRRDERVPASDVEGWFGESSAPGQLHWFDGGHFFLHEEQDLLIARLKALMG